MRFCQYRDLFGEPNQGIHQYRFGGVAVVDLLETFVLAYLTTLATRIPLAITLVSWLLIGFAFHLLFCVQTSVMTYLGIHF